MWRYRNRKKMAVWWEGQIGVLYQKPKNIMDCQLTLEARKIKEGIASTEGICSEGIWPSWDFVLFCFRLLFSRPVKFLLFYAIPVCRTFWWQLRKTNKLPKLEWQGRCWPLNTADQAGDSRSHSCRSRNHCALQVPIKENLITRKQNLFLQ